MLRLYVLMGSTAAFQPRRLSWYLCSCSVSYTLTWLPAPVRQWSLLPNDETPDRAQVLAQINSILEHRGCGRTAEPFLPPTQGFWNQKITPGHWLGCCRMLNTIQ